MFVLGVTGTTGSGKTLFCSYLKELGASIIDCDAAYHELLRSSKALNREIILRFPAVENGGFADRKALARIVFADKEALKTLETIVFPHIRKRIVRLLDGERCKGVKLAVLDAPTLIESGADALCDHVVALTAGKEDQILRLLERDHMLRPEAELRISTRPDEEFYIHRNCEMIRNDGGMDKLKSEAARVYFALSEKENYNG